MLLLNGLPGEEQHNQDQVLGAYASVLAPGVISADSPRFLGFIRPAPRPPCVDMLVSCASVRAPGWRPPGQSRAENLRASLGWAARQGQRFRGQPVGADGVTREVAKRRVGEARGHRFRAVRRDAHSSIGNTLRILEMGALIVTTSDHRDRAPRATAAIEADGDPSSRSSPPLAPPTQASTVIRGAAEIARDYGLWFHVNGAYRWRRAVRPERPARPYDGIEHADSFVLDPHKWLFAPFLRLRGAAVPRPGACPVGAPAGRLVPRCDPRRACDWNPTELRLPQRRARLAAMVFPVGSTGPSYRRGNRGGDPPGLRKIAAEIARRSYLELIREPDLGIVLFPPPRLNGDSVHRLGGPVAGRPGGVPASVGMGRRDRRQVRLPAPAYIDGPGTSSTRPDGMRRGHPAARHKATASVTTPAALASAAARWPVTSRTPPQQHNHQVRAHDGQSSGPGVSTVTPMPVPPGAACWPAGGCRPVAVPAASWATHRPATRLAIGARTKTSSTPARAIIPSEESATRAPRH